MLPIPVSSMLGHHSAAGHPHALHAGVTPSSPGLTLLALAPPMCHAPHLGMDLGWSPRGCWPLCACVSAGALCGTSPGTRQGCCGTARAVPGSHLLCGGMVTLIFISVLCWDTVTGGCCLRGTLGHAKLWQPDTELRVSPFGEKLFHKAFIS